MENLLKVHLKAIDKFYFFYWIIVGIFVITLILSTINYCLIHYSLEFLEENDPDIKNLFIRKVTSERVEKFLTDNNSTVRFIPIKTN